MTKYRLLEKKNPRKVWKNSNFAETQRNLDTHNLSFVCRHNFILCKCCWKRNFIQLIRIIFFEGQKNNKPSSFLCILSWNDLHCCFNNTSYESFSLSYPNELIGIIYFLSYLKKWMVHRIWDFQRGKNCCTFPKIHVQSSTLWYSLVWLKRYKSDVWIFSFISKKAPMLYKFKTLSILKFVYVDAKTCLVLILQFWN